MPHGMLNLGVRFSRAVECLTAGTFSTSFLDQYCSRTVSTSLWKIHRVYIDYCRAL